MNEENRDRVAEFVERIRRMSTDAIVLGVLTLLERSGVFAMLAREGALTADAIAARAGSSAAQLRDALAAMAAAGFLDYDEDARAFSIGPVAAAGLADPQAPFSVGGVAQMVCGLLETLPRVAASLASGRGIPADGFSEHFVAGYDRVSRAQYGAYLCTLWLPEVTGAVERLRRGARVADVGCGAGAASRAIAQAFPRSSVLGIDIDPRAIARAEDAPIANARFAVASAEELPLEPRFDLVLAMAVLHNLPDPIAALDRIRRALADEGVLFLMQPRSAERISDNLGETGALVYGLSALYSVPLSLAQGGAGLGAARGPEEIEAIARAAGFTRFRRLAIPHPLSAFYALRP
jgi:SAM-dependent methyltransferase